MKKKDRTKAQQRALDDALLAIDAVEDLRRELAYASKRLRKLYELADEHVGTPK